MEHLIRSLMKSLATNPPKEQGAMPTRTLLRLTLRALLTPITLLCTATLWAHAGGLDQNGGHYQFNSYHCHLGGC